MKIYLQLFFPSPKGPFYKLYPEKEKCDTLKDLT